MFWQIDTPSWSMKIMSWNMYVTSWSTRAGAPGRPSSGNIAVSLRALQLRDGRVAIVGGDSNGGGTDRGFVTVLNELGADPIGPTWTPIPNNAHAKRHGMKLARAAPPTGRANKDDAKTALERPIVFGSAARKIAARRGAPSRGRVSLWSAPFRSTATRSSNT